MSNFICPFIFTISVYVIGATGFKDYLFNYYYIINIFFPR